MVSLKEREKKKRVRLVLGAAAAMYISSRRDRNDTIGPQVFLLTHPTPMR